MADKIESSRRVDRRARSTEFARVPSASAKIATLAALAALVVVLPCTWSLARADEPLPDLGRPANASPLPVPAAAANESGGAWSSTSASAAPSAALTDPSLRPGSRSSVDGESRLRLAPRVGGGIGFLAGHLSPFPHVIGLTEIGGELSYEVVPWAGWIQGSFLSSGAAGEWNAPSLAAGVTYRLFGDGLDRASLLLRGGIVYERWHAATNACNVTLFFPSSCRAFPPRTPDGTIAPSYSVTDDNGQTLGLVAGARLELPLRPVYLALDATFVPSVDVSDPVPGSVFTFRFALVFGFRDRRGVVDQKERPDNRRMIR